MSFNEEPHRMPSLWLTVGKLLHLRILIMMRSFRRTKTRQKIGTIMLTLLILGFLGILLVGSFSLLRLLRSPELAQLTGDITPLIESVPILILNGAFLGILLTSFGVLLQALYLAGDMDFLLSIPIPIRAVFISKLLQAILPNLGLISLFALPVLYGLGLSNQYHFLYYPSVLLTLIALALAAAGISSLLVMVLVRILPARRLAEILGFLGAILSMLCSQSGQLANWEEVSPQQADQAIGLLTRFNTPWSPLTWVGRGLVAMGEGHWAYGIGSILLILGLAGLIFGVTLRTAEKFYYSGWARMKNQGRKKKAPRRDSTPSRKAPLTKIVATWSGRLLPSSVRAVLGKDFLVLRRDLRNMSQLITPLMIGILYAVMIFRSSSEPNTLPEDLPTWLTTITQSIKIYSSVGLSLFVSWMLLARLAGMGFSQEGRNYWLLKTAPISTSQLILAKFLVAYLPTLGFSWMFLLAAWILQNAGLSVLLFSLPVVGLSIAGNNGINLAFGIFGANMTWEDPRQMQRTSSGCLGAVASIVYLPATLLLFFAPPIGAITFGLPESVGQLIGLALGGGFCMACAVIPLWLVRKQVPRLGEA